MLSDIEVGMLNVTFIRFGYYIAEKDQRSNSHVDLVHGIKIMHAYQIE